MHMYDENNSMVETLWKAKPVVSVSTVEVTPGSRDVTSECSCVQLGLQVHMKLRNPWTIYVFLFFDWESHFEIAVSTSSRAFLAFWIMALAASALIMARPCLSSSWPHPTRTFLLSAKPLNLPSSWANHLVVFLQLPLCLYLPLLFFSALFPSSFLQFLWDERMLFTTSLKKDRLWGLLPYLEI